MTVVVNNPVAGFAPLNYGAFLDNNTQTNAGAIADPVTGNVMLLRTTDYSNGVSIVSNSRITVSTAGVYNIQFSSQFGRVGGVGFSIVDVWLSKNGTIVVGSNGQVNVPQSGGKNIAAWNYVVQANSGDYFQLNWYSTDVNIEMFHAVAGTTPARPVTPSVILTVTQVA
jgi:hypothetical protein